jgi:hypothetical protein
MAGNEKEADIELECHKKSAVDLFNLAWALYDKRDRTREEDEEMIYAAYASRYHWGKIESVVGRERWTQAMARGEWQISRMYIPLNHPEAALHHAKRSLEHCREHGIGDFDLAFAYEAVARAYAIGGNEAERDKYVELAKKAGEEIAEKENKDYFLSELATVPGYK